MSYKELLHPISVLQLSCRTIISQCCWQTAAADRRGSGRAVGLGWWCGSKP